MRAGAYEGTGAGVAGWVLGLGLRPLKAVCTLDSEPSL